MEMYKMDLKSAAGERLHANSWVTKSMKADV
jgi:hypothetical protein